MTVTLTRTDPVRGGATRLASDMVLVHKVFRRELRLLPSLVAKVAPAQVERAALLGRHYRELATALRHHHQAEQDLLWRRLSERTHLDPALEDRMRQGHRRHVELLGELDGMLDLWLAAADGDVRDLLVDILAELADDVAAHLDMIESRVLPEVDRHFTQREWLALGLRAAGWIPLNRMAWMLGAMLEDATDEERRALMAKVPAPARMLYRMVGQEQYVREMRELRRCSVPA
ncbi:hemerythrin domain-containing protein [Nakamurella sp.]|uniref:hemerythrin domain-containing protein n=1 Tax=Nakamurella sp. TaxID=1869182 RepID=UPI003B3B8741